MLQTSLLNELLLFIGHYVLECKLNQETLHYGHRPICLILTKEIPSEYLFEPQLQQFLFPTLIAVTQLLDCEKVFSTHACRSHLTLIRTRGSLLTTYPCQALLVTFAVTRLVTTICMLYSDHSFAFAVQEDATRESLHMRFPPNLVQDAIKFLECDE